MAHTTMEIVLQYEERVRANPNVPRLSYGRRLLRDDGDANCLFFTYLFIDPAMAIGFLTDSGAYSENDDLWQV
jgi:hypothetical protein